MDSLTDLERAMLDLEQQWWGTAAGKEDAIRAMGMSPVRYYQLLRTLIDTEQAVAYAPVVVNRLRRLATKRQQATSFSLVGEVE